MGRTGAIPCEVLGEVAGNPVDIDTANIDHETHRRRRPTLPYPSEVDILVDQNVKVRIFRFFWNSSYANVLWSNVGGSRF